MQNAKEMQNAIKNHKKCLPCPRTPVYHVSELNTWGGGGRRTGEGSVADRAAVRSDSRALGIIMSFANSAGSSNRTSPALECDSESPKVHPLPSNTKAKEQKEARAQWNPRRDQ